MKIRYKLSLLAAVLILVLSVFSVCSYADVIAPAENIRCPKCLNAYEGYEDEECPFCGYLTYHCPNCMGDISIEDDICFTCGFDVANTRQCMHCGRTCSKYNNTCVNCGEKTVNIKQYHGVVSYRTCSECGKDTYGALRSECIYCGHKLPDKLMKISKFSAEKAKEAETQPQKQTNNYNIKLNFLAVFSVAVISTCLAGAITAGFKKKKTAGNKPADK